GGMAAVSSAPVATWPESSPAPPSTTTTPSAISFAAQSSVDFGRESTARSSDLIFTEPPAAAPSATPAAVPNTVAESALRARNLGLAAVLGLDIATDAVREARQLIFESSARREAQRANIGDEVFAPLGSASPGSVKENVTGMEVSVKAPWNA